MKIANNIKTPTRKSESEFLFATRFPKALGKGRTVFKLFFAWKKSYKRSRQTCSLTAFFRTDCIATSLTVSHAEAFGARVVRWRNLRFPHFEIFPLAVFVWIEYCYLDAAARPTSQCSSCNFLTHCFWQWVNSRKVWKILLDIFINVKISYNHIELRIGYNEDFQ